MSVAPSQLRKRRLLHDERCPLPPQRSSLRERAGRLRASRSAAIPHIAESGSRTTRSHLSGLFARHPGLEPASRRPLITVTFFIPDAKLPFALRAVNVRLRVACAPAMQRIPAFPAPLVMVPLVTVQTWIAPASAFGTLTRFLAEPLPTPPADTRPSGRASAGLRPSGISVALTRPGTLFPSIAIAQALNLPRQQPENKPNTPYVRERWARIVFVEPILEKSPHSIASRQSRCTLRTGPARPARRLPRPSVPEGADTRREDPSPGTRPRGGAFTLQVDVREPRKDAFECHRPVGEA